MYEVVYDTYNPGQYPAEFKAAVEKRIADGYRIFDSQLNYTEVYILWLRTDEGLTPRKDADIPDPHSQVLLCANCQEAGEPSELSATQPVPPDLVQKVPAGQ